MFQKLDSTAIKGNSGAKFMSCIVSVKASRNDLMCRERLCALDADGIYGDKPLGVIVLHITICL